MRTIARRPQSGKIWLNVLIFANCVLWLWPLGAEEALTKQAILTEFRPSLTLLSKASTLRLLTRQAQGGELQQPKICQAWGPYSEVNDVRALEQTVIAEGVETEVFESEVRGEPDYLVYIESTATPGGARRALEELKTQAIESHLIVQGRFSDTLSVGVFSQKARAERQQEKVSALGFAVVIEELQHTQQVYHLLAKVPADFMTEIAPSGVCSEIAPIHQFL